MATGAAPVYDATVIIRITRRTIDVAATRGAIKGGSAMAIKALRSGLLAAALVVLVQASANTPAASASPVPPAYSPVAVAGRGSIGNGQIWDYYGQIWDEDSAAS